VAGVGGGGVDHPLLVAGLVVGEFVLILEQRLAYARDVAVAENAEAAGEEAPLLAVAFDVLVRQEADQRLGHSQPYRTRCPVARAFRPSFGV
jgi:hypothetical protein